MPELKRVLIANRGEIAVRIAKAARGLGIESIGVHAPEDAKALHTQICTRSVALPGSGVAAYLDIEAVITAAKQAGCDCVHPGYGFLSESHDFAVACAAAELTFIGPSPDALKLFGDKIAARTLAESLEIPVIRGAPALSTADAAADAAQAAGYPVMLKASAGGGGRGMRVVESAKDMPEAFARCQGEAEAAFGDGTLFLEKLVRRPRHIEVQVLGDASGAAIHLFERDCSVQLRNQKIVEIAPAPNLPEDLRARLHADAIKLVKAAGYYNAGTVEFLIAPEVGGHYFIECNPRIQVEHTITEQVMGVDLVEAQFLIAAGENLADLGLGDQSAVGAPRGVAIQTRVTVQGAGTITGYKEPSGPGIRVDAAGYLGLAPPPAFDPLLAKLIVTAASHEAAITRSLAALDEFHITGVPTNLGQLTAILSHADLSNGDARTTLLSEHPDLASTSAALGKAAGFLSEQAAAVQGPGIAAPKSLQVQNVDLPSGALGVECPMGGTMIQINVKVGDAVKAGQTLYVISAMKMEAAVTAPGSGEITAVLALAEGDTVEPGQIIAAVQPAAGDADRDAAARDPSDTWMPTLEEVQTLQGLALKRLSADSQEPGVVRQRSRGKLTCRERIDLLLDDGSFREVGSLAGFATYDADGGVEAFTPANHVGGWGRVEGRMTIVCADDFTSRGGHSDGAIASKSRHLDQLSMEMKTPSVRLLDGSSGGGSVASMVPTQQKSGESDAKESSGAIKAGRPRVTGSGGSFLPQHLGSEMYAEQLAMVPVVNMLLGSVVGLGAAKAVLGHFSVMLKDTAQLFVAGPPVVSHAMGYDITKEDLGGWHIHCTNGSVDNLAVDEQDAVNQTRKFLSYLPPNVFEAPPIAPSDDSADRCEEELFHIIPRQRNATFNMRRLIDLLVDQGSFFEIGSLWGTDQITGFARFQGRPVGIIASDCRHLNGGALTADGCDKLKRHLDLCDLFHIPVVNLVDNPGFAVGLEHEINGTIRKGGEWMIAFAQVRIPIFTAIVRRSFGVAGNNYAAPRRHPQIRVVWPAADAGGIPPEGGIEAAYKRQLAEASDPAALRAEIEARIESARGPIGPLNRFEMEEMIDPRQTRPLICEWVETAYQIVSHPTDLNPRPLGFRP